jgi:hypothetical protein
MSSLTDRRNSILGRLRTLDPTTKPKRVRAPRPAKSLVVLPVDQGDPIAAFRAFPRNTRLHAEFWLANGYLHQDVHFVIRARLEPWVAQVRAGGGELRAALVGEIRLETVASRNTPEIHFEDPQKPSLFQGSDIVNPPLPANDTGEAVSGGIEQAEPSNSAKSPTDGSTRGVLEPTGPAEYPPHWEVLTDPVEIRKRRRGYSSVFEAEFWGETPKLPAYPSYPAGKVSGITLAKYRAKLLPAIRDCSAPALLPAKVALAALRIDKEIPATFDPRLRPAWWRKWLPVARQDGEWWVERDELREHLFPEEYLGPRPACPIVIPRCRHCGRLSHHGWADQVCDRCEAIRPSIETAQTSRFSVAERRGWKGPPVSTDDELLPAIQRRRANTDRTTVANAAKEERRASREKRRQASEGELLDEAA